MDTVISKIEKKIAGEKIDSDSESDVMINHGPVPDDAGVAAIESPVIGPTEINVDMTNKQSSSMIGDTCYTNFFAKH